VKNNIYLFYRDFNSACCYRLFDGTSWNGPYNLGCTLISNPAAVSWGENRIDVFAEGIEGYLIYVTLWDGKWNEWKTLGSKTIVGTPAVTSLAPNDIYCFARGTDNRLYYVRWNGSDWGNWSDLGGSITSSPAVASWGPNRIDVVAVGENRNLLQKYGDGVNWSDWINLGGICYEQPGICSRGPNRLDIFVQGSDCAIWHKECSNVWYDWEDLGAKTHSSITATSPGNGQMIYTFSGNHNNACLKKI